MSKKKKKKTKNVRKRRVRIIETANLKIDIES